MGRKTLFRHCRVIVVTFDDQEYRIKLDKKEKIINNNVLEDLKSISKIHKRRQREKRMELKELKKLKKNELLSQNFTIKEDSVTKEPFIFDNLHTEEEMMKDFFLEIESEYLSIFGSSDHTLPQ